MSVLLTSATTAQYLLFEENSDMLYGTLTMGSSSSLLMTKIVLTSTTGTLFAKSGFIRSPSELFFLGSTSKINTQTFNYQVGFIMSYPSTNCLSTTTSTVTLTATYQALFIGIAIPTPPIWTQTTSTPSGTS